MITVSDLTRRFGAFTAVDRISFRLEKGEVVGFLGLNGAGKTTTMRMLTGFLPATTGAIEIAGFDVLRESLEVRSRIGYLPEAVPLYREHRVEEMLLFQARLHRIGRADARRRAGEVLERVGLTDRRRSIVGRLSKGQRQRVGLAVALLPDPEVLILDEPTSGLDPLQRIEVRRLLGELARERTVLLSSHILPEIEAAAPRVIIMHRGRIVADGTPEELVRRLGGQRFVRLEAVVPDSAEAARLLGTLPGVDGVRELGAQGIHRGFEVVCGEDLREDVGALCVQRTWAVRELSWHSPTLEELFARIALDLDPAEDAGSRDDLATAPPDPGRAPAAAAAPAPSPVAAPTVPVSEDEPRVLYNLNPFDQGATRDLARPKAVEPPGLPGAPAPPPAAPCDDAGEDASDDASRGTEEAGG